MKSQGPTSKVFRPKKHDKYSAKKSWLQRKGGIMKKAEEIREKFNAEVALFIKKDGVLYAYLSQDDFAAVPDNCRLKECNKMTPDDYRSVRQDRGDSDGDSESEGSSSAGSGAARGIATMHVVKGHEARSAPEDPCQTQGPWGANEPFDQWVGEYFNTHT